MDGWRSSQPVLGVLPMKILGALIYGLAFLGALHVAEMITHDTIGQTIIAMIGGLVVSFGWFMFLSLFEAQVIKDWQKKRPSYIAQWGEP